MLNSFHPKELPDRELGLRKEEKIKRNYKKNFNIYFIYRIIKSIVFHLYIDLFEKKKKRKIIFDEYIRFLVHMNYFSNHCNYQKKKEECQFFFLHFHIVAFMNMCVCDPFVQYLIFK